MNAKKWILVVVSAAIARRYPVLWTAVLFAAVPVLLRAGSSPVGGVLLLPVGDAGIRCVPVIGAAVFVSSLLGLLKYGSRDELLAYVLWVVTFVSAAVLGIVMVEAFGPPRQWSGSLRLPGVVLLHCCAGTMLGVAIRAASLTSRRLH
jgi:hypothetical protein